MKRYDCVFALTAFVAAFVPGVLHAAGLGNLTYTAAELEKPIATFGPAGTGRFPSGPTGSNTVLMLRDVLVVIASVDSGVPPLGIHIFDVKDPRSPKLLKSVTGTPELALGREIHSMPVAMINGKDIVVLQTISGVMFYDFTDPLNPKHVSSFALTGVNRGDYDNAAWMLSWTYPYLFVAGTGNGVYVVDATDPAAPKMVTRIATGVMGNFRIGPVFAAGNYLVVTGMDQPTTGISIVDVGNPSAPFLLTTTTIPSSLYAAVVVGDRIYGPGTNGDYVFMKWTPTAITMLGRKTSGTDRGGYCTVQSGFVVCGQSAEGYKKWDVRNEANIVQTGRGTDPAAVGGDFDFATILGNLVYLGNDHATGAALIPHTTAPDTAPPEVAKVYPLDGETRQPLTTRVTVFFSEDLDLGTVSTASIFVRKSGGTALEGTFSKSSFNAISFGPKVPLEANTTYEVVVPAGGLKDLVGNTLATAAISRFSTGTSVTMGAGGAGGGTVGGTGGIGTGGAGGGAVGSGGASTGGATSTGGMIGSAGGAASGGMSGGGGSGGVGVISSGGTGGGLAATGGAGPSTGTGGASASSGGTGVPITPGTSAGCGCNVSGDLGSAGVLSFFFGALVLALGARRARPRRSIRMISRK